MGGEDGLFETEVREKLHFFKTLESGFFGVRSKALVFVACDVVFGEA